MQVEGLAYTMIAAYYKLITADIRQHDGRRNPKDHPCNYKWLHSLEPIRTQLLNAFLHINVKYMSDKTGNIALDHIQAQTIGIT